MAEEIEIRKGSAVGILTPSTKEDFDFINSNLREMDQFEHDYFRNQKDIGKIDELSVMDKSWTLHLGGNIVGFVGLQVLGGLSKMSNVRYVPMLSTKYVDDHKIDYARLSKVILKWVLEQAEEWVTDFISMPLCRYEASVRWHEKTMGWHRIKVFDAYGEKAVLFHLSREEIRKWK